MPLEFPTTYDQGEIVALPPMQFIPPTMPIRLQVAAMILETILNRVYDTGRMVPKVLAEEAVDFADELIRQTEVKGDGR